MLKVVLRENIGSIKPMSRQGLAARQIDSGEEGGSCHLWSVAILSSVRIAFLYIRPVTSDPVPSGFFKSGAFADNFFF